MIVAAVVVAGTASHAIGGMAVEFDADRLRGTVAGAAIDNGAKAVGHGAVAGGAGGAIFTCFTGIADLRRASGHQHHRQGDDETKGDEE